MQNYPNNFFFILEQKKVIENSLILSHLNATIYTAVYTIR